jgi:hypothetical protein
MADKLQPTCLPQRRPRHPTDFYALLQLDALGAAGRLKVGKTALYKAFDRAKADP